MGVRYRHPARRLERLRRELAAVLPRIIDAQTDQVILFGSAARGTPGPTSDLDLIVVRRDDRPPAQRVHDLYRRARPQVAMDLLVYTPEELAAALETSSFVRHALRDGEIVYDRGRALA